MEICIFSIDTLNHDLLEDYFSESSKHETSQQSKLIQLLIQVPVVKLQTFHNSLRQNHIKFVYYISYCTYKSTSLSQP